MSRPERNPELSIHRPEQDYEGTLFEQAHARNSDGKHSHDAAASVVNLGKLRDAIIRALKAGPKTDEEIADWLYGIHFTPSGLRSRRNELVRMGFVREVGTGVTAAKRPCAIWGITEMSTDDLRRTR